MAYCVIRVLWEFFIVNIEHILFKSRKKYLFFQNENAFTAVYLLYSTVSQV